MPGWLLSILTFFAPKVIEWALQLLEQRYPGLKPIIDQIIAFISGSGNPAAATAQVKAHLDKLTTQPLPDTVGNT